MNAARILETLTAAGVELIADPPLIRVKPISKLPPWGPDMIRAHKPELLALLTGRTWYGFTLADLEREADPQEWPELSVNPGALETFALALRESHQVEAGTRPERWTGTATCAHCGPVPVAPCLDGQRLVGCRWCARRRAGLPTPPTAT